MAVFAMSVTMLSPLLIEIARRFNLSITQSGLLFTINFLGFAVFTLLGGALAEKFGKKAVLTVCLFGLAFSSILIAVTNNFYIILILMFAYGGFGGAMETFASALVSDLNPEQSAYYINLSQVYFGLGAIIAPLAAGYVIAKGMNYTLCYWGLGIICLLCAVDFARLKLPALPSDEGITKQDLKQLLTNKNFWLVCLCLYCYTGSEVATWGWMSTFLQENLQFSSIYSSIALATFWLAMTIGRFICGKLTKKYKLGSIIFWLALSSTVVAVISGFTNRTTFFIVSFLLGLACSSQFPLLLAYGDQFVKRGKNSAFALFVVSANMGSLSIPYLIGLVGERGGIRAAMMFPSVFFLIVVLTFVYFNGRKSHSRIDCA